jgi:hypothetical protein
MGRIPEDDIPPEVQALRERLSHRENCIMNTIGIMAMLDADENRDMAEALQEVLFTVANVTHEEFHRLAELYNQTVEVLMACVGIADFDMDDLNG